MVLIRISACSSLPFPKAAANVGRLRGGAPFLGPSRRRLIGIPRQPREDTVRFRIAALCPIVALAMTTPSPAQNGHAPKLIAFEAPDAGTVSSPLCAPACGTLALANNAEGAVVGYYTDANIVNHGFLRTPNGHILSFDAPGASLGAKLDQGTFPFSINDWGLIAGALQDSGNAFHGFVRYPDGSFSTFDALAAGTSAFQGTEAFDVNLEGATAGIYVDGNSVEHGFVRSRFAEITTIDPEGSTGTMVCEETCLNAEGAITGSFSDSKSNYHGFVRDGDGKITKFDAPGAGTGVFQGTFSASINLEGTTTGYLVDAGNVISSFVRTRDGHFTTFHVPAAGTGPGQGTGTFSINLFGVVTGEFLDGNSAMHGFSRLPCGDITTFDARGGGKGAGQGTRPSTNNLEGAVTGWFIDDKNLNHGFIWNP
jgi:hypothetical protein